MLGQANLLSTLILAVLALGLGLVICLLLGGKTLRARLLMLGTIFFAVWPLTLVGSFIAFDYYETLSTEALYIFMLAACVAGIACRSWAEWISPPSHWKERRYREKSIIVGIAATIVGVGVTIFLLPRVPALLTDIASGPSFKSGKIENLALNPPTRGIVLNGDFVVDGISYRTNKLAWYSSLSVGQYINFAYAPNSHNGFPAELLILSPLGVVFPFAVLGLGLLLFGIFVLVARLFGWRK